MRRFRSQPVRSTASDDGDSLDFVGSSDDDDDDDDDNAEDDAQTMTIRSRPSPSYTRRSVRSGSSGARRLASPTTPRSGGRTKERPSPSPASSVAPSSLLGLFGSPPSTTTTTGSSPSTTITTVSSLSRSPGTRFLARAPRGPTRRATTVTADRRNAHWSLLRDDIQDTSDTLATAAAALLDTTTTDRPQSHRSRTLETMLTATVELTLLLSEQSQRALLHRDWNKVDELQRTVLPALADTLWHHRHELAEEAAVDQATHAWSPHGEAERLGLARLYEGTCYLLHFLTLDCTLSEFSAGADHASQTRDLFLKQPQIMQAVAHVVDWDPWTHRLVRERPGMATTRDTDHQPNTLSAHETATKQASPGRSTDSACSSVDPTVQGRLRKRERKRHRQQQSLPTGPLGDDEWSIPSSPSMRHSSQTEVRPDWVVGLETIAVRVQDTLPSVAHSGVAETTSRSSPTAQGSRTCNVCQGSGWYYRLPWLALNRIVLGKMDGADDSETCIEQDKGDSIDVVDDDHDGDDEDDGNALLRTNRLLRKAEILPLLTKSLVDSLIAACHQASHPSEACPHCCRHVQERIHALVSLLDGACLLDEMNRASICREGFSQEFSGSVVAALFTTLVTFMDHGLLLHPGGFGDMAHDVLRLLTSLSHENTVSAMESDRLASHACLQATGTQVLANIMHFLARAADDSEAQGRLQEPMDQERIDKLRHDASIFCLNTLVNLVESKACRLIIAETLVPVKSGRSQIFISWLTRWLVQQTGTFRDAVSESTFGLSPSKHADRCLQAGEEEKLMIAGNGFIFLTCLLVEGVATHARVTNQLRQCILAEIPGDLSLGKVRFIKNTLKAFCNFYHSKIGDLAIAVVTPVKALLEQLDAVLWLDQGTVKVEADSCDSSFISREKTLKRTNLFAG